MDTQEQGKNVNWRKCEELCLRTGSLFEVLCLRRGSPFEELRLRRGSPLAFGVMCFVRSSLRLQLSPVRIE